MRSKEQSRKTKSKGSARDLEACQEFACKSISEARALERILKSVKLSRKIDNIRKKGFVDDNQGYLTQNTMQHNGVSIFDTKNITTKQRNFMD